MSTVRVLCVEHHVEYLDPLKDMLETAGYEVVSATREARVSRCS